MSSEYWWRGRTEVLAGKLVPVSLCPPQIPHSLVSDWTKAFARRLSERRLCPALSGRTSASNNYFSSGACIFMVLDTGIKWCVCVCVCVCVCARARARPYCSALSQFNKNNFVVRLILDLVWKIVHWVLVLWRQNKYEPRNVTSWLK